MEPSNLFSYSGHALFAIAQLSFPSLCWPFTFPLEASSSPLFGLVLGWAEDPTMDNQNFVPSSSQKDTFLTWIQFAYSEASFHHFDDPHPFSTPAPSVCSQVPTMVPLYRPVLGYTSHFAPAGWWEVPSNLYYTPSSFCFHLSWFFTSSLKKKKYWAASPTSYMSPLYMHNSVVFMFYRCMQRSPPF